jgi:endo-1,4-beta-mannosidase
MPAEHAPFRIGINYWPGRSAMAWWGMFEEGEVAEDLARIAGAGFDSVRLFLMWEAFQPDTERVDRTMLERLITFADVALDAGLRVMPTLFTGHMSGANWIPGWALGGSDRDPRFRVISGGRPVGEGLRNWYTDPSIGRAQALLARESAAALSGHEALWAWDLGNENSNCVVPPDRAAGLRWLEQMAAAIRGADGTALITAGLHMEDLEHDRRLGPREVARTCDFLTMHGYPIYAAWAEGVTDVHLVPFLAEVTRWLGGGSDVHFSEFGLPTYRAGEPGNADASPEPLLVEESDAARYTDRVLAGLAQAGCMGAMLWCHADYAPDIWAQPPLDESVHERSFGLWRADATPKPAVAAVAAHRGTRRLDPPDTPWIDIDQQRYWEGPETELPRLYRRYRGR